MGPDGIELAAEKSVSPVLNKEVDDKKELFKELVRKAAKLELVAQEKKGESGEENLDTQANLLQTLKLYQEAVRMLPARAAKVARKVEELKKDCQQRGLDRHPQAFTLCTDAETGLFSDNKDLQSLPFAGCWWRNLVTDRLHLAKPKREDEDNDTKSDIIKFHQKPSKFALDPAIFELLYPHQRAGLAWLAWLHTSKQPGGILGDDMGLGKTIQVCAFIRGLLDSRLGKRVLLLSPISVLAHWQEQLSKWCPRIRLVNYHGDKSKQTEASLRRVMENGGVCLTTYGLLKSRLQRFCAIPGSATEVKWDWFVLDEGHQIRNPSTQVAKAVRHVPAKHRLLLTGTPVQNNLDEFWALFDFVCKGSLLGERRVFKANFGSAIEAGAHRDASSKKRQLGAEMTKALRELVAPYLLRREKHSIPDLLTRAAQGPPQPIISAGPAAAVTPTAVSSELDQPAQAGQGGEIVQIEQPQKNDLVVWVKLSEAQVTIYRAFLQSPEVKTALNSTQSPLAALTVLKKLCDHPKLLTEEMQTCGSLLQQLQQLDYAADALVAQSGKLTVLVPLLLHYRQHGHRTLIFSQSKKLLDLVEIVLRSYKMSLLRLDGKVVGAAARQALINDFNKDTRYSCFLITTQTGGLGINLTGADRVVIFDPTWNPATDNQAVDRAFRVGQTRHVVVTRFVTCGTLEEVIYRKQVFKARLLKSTVGEKKGGGTEWQGKGYFNKQDLRDVFTLEDPTCSRTQQQLMRLHPPEERKSYADLQTDLATIQAIPEVFGISDHDLLFTETNNERPEETDEETLELAARMASLAVTPHANRKKQKATTPVANLRPLGRPAEASRARPNGSRDHNLPQPVPARDELPAPKPAHARVKTAHVTAAEEDKEKEFTVCRPLTQLTAKQRQEYDELLRGLQATSREHSQRELATSREHLQRQLWLVLSALSICDQDLTLQRHACHLAQRLGLVSSPPSKQKDASDYVAGASVTVGNPMAVQDWAQPGMQ